MVQELKPDEGILPKRRKGQGQPQPTEMVAVHHGKQWLAGGFKRLKRITSIWRWLVDYFS